MHITTLLRAGTILAVLTGSGVAIAADLSYDQTFLTDYSKLQPRPTDKGTDLTYIAPGALQKLANYTAIMVDQPEVMISPASDYKGAKPDDLAAVANMMRESMTQRLQQGGLTVAQAPGPGVMYIRMALTDLQLKKKKRALLAYTPIGAVVKAGRDAIVGMMEKYDIMNMVIQAELTDSVSNEVLAEVVGIRGGGAKPVRLDFDQVDANMTDFVSRLRCRLDNSHVAQAQQIDCLDAKARQAREAATKPKT